MHKYTIAAAVFVLSVLSGSVAASAEDDVPTEVITEPTITPAEGPEPADAPPEPYEPPTPADDRPIEGNVEPLPQETKAPPPEIFQDVSKQIRTQEQKGNVGR